jgi:hypothetical protein
MTLTRKQVELYNFLTNLNVIKSCNDNEYKEIIESLTSEIQNDTRKIEYLTELLLEFKRFSTELSKHLMVKRDDIKRKQSQNEKEPPTEIDDFYDITTASTLLGVSRQTMYNLIKDNKVRSVRKSEKKQVILKTDLEKFQKGILSK